MLRRVYKLHFITPVHFGAESGGDKLSSLSMSFRADQLFSALFDDAMLDWVRDGSLWFSDAFPFHNNILYIPKPVGIWSRDIGDPSVRKLFKKIEYIPLDQIDNYIHGKCDPKELRVSFGTRYEMTRLNKRDFELPLPYQVAGFRFADDCGLYVIAAGEEEAMEGFDRRMKSLSGIGGKVSSGWGKFTVEEAELPLQLAAAMDNEQAPYQMLLSSALPREEELASVLETGTWLLVRRGGFAFSPSSNSHKKKTVFLLGSGSVFSHRFVGTMLDVGQSMPHPVWRYAMAGFMAIPCGESILSGQNMPIPSGDMPEVDV